MDINFALDTQKKRNQLKLNAWPQPRNSLRMLKSTKEINTHKSPDG